ncbi:hypothetical protein FAIPA1_60161 [Frankia sp. AiPs1]
MGGPSDIPYPEIPPRRGRRPRGIGPSGVPLAGGNTGGPISKVVRQYLAPEHRLTGSPGTRDTGACDVRRHGRNDAAAARRTMGFVPAPERAESQARIGPTFLRSRCRRSRRNSGKWPATSFQSSPGRLGNAAGPGTPRVPGRPQEHPLAGTVRAVRHGGDSGAGAAERVAPAPRLSRTRPDVHHRTVPLALFRRANGLTMRSRSASVIPRIIVTMPAGRVTRGAPGHPTCRRLLVVSSRPRSATAMVAGTVA